MQAPQQAAGLDLFAALQTTSAHRRFKPDPVPPEAIEQLVFYATRAGSASNTQPWEFVVVTDADQRAEIGRLYLEASYESPHWDSPQHTSPNQLARQLGDVPCLILVCLQGQQPEEPAQLLVRYASIFPAIQNLLLAARGLGLGAVLTTRHRRREAEIKQLLGIPDDVETVCLLPIGYPERDFVTVKNRKDPSEVTHWNGW